MAEDYLWWERWLFQVTENPIVGRVLTATFTAMLVAYCSYMIFTQWLKSLSDRFAARVWTLAEV